jgi:hypothetical protein
MRSAKASIFCLRSRAAGRDRERATEQLQGPLGVAEAGLADLGHLLERDDLLGGVRD